MTSSFSALLVVCFCYVTSSLYTFFVNKEGCDDIALSKQILVFTCARSGSLCHSLLSWPLVSSL